MKWLLTILTVSLVTGAAFLTFNTLRAQKIISVPALARLPTTTWSDLVQSAQSIHPATSSAQITPATTSKWLSSSWQTIQSELGAVGKQTAEATKHAQNVIGNKPLIGVANPTSSQSHDQTSTATDSATLSATTAQTISPTSEPFYTKALEYSKYVYCQDVVKAYEQQHPEVKK